MVGGLLWGSGRGKGTRGASGHRPVGGAVDWARSGHHNKSEAMPLPVVRPFREALIFREFFDIV